MPSALEKGQRYFTHFTFHDRVSVLTDILTTSLNVLKMIYVI